MVEKTLHTAAKKIEAIIEDDDDLTSLCIWFDIGGYIALARELDESDIECEFADQINGFKAKKITYKAEGNLLILQLGDGEYFDREHTCQGIVVEIDARKFNTKEISTCLNSLFVK